MLPHLTLLAILALCIVAPGRLRRRVRSGTLGRGGALLRCVGWTILPTLAYTALFFAMVGLEEVTGQALIAEEYGRSLLLLVAAGLALCILTTLIFGIVLAFTPRPPGNTYP